jgi:hypothetical protein
MRWSWLCCSAAATGLDKGKWMCEKVDAELMGICGGVGLPRASKTRLNHMGEGDHSMTHMNCKLAAAVLLSAGILVLASCSSDKKKAEPSAATGTGTTVVSVTPGVAGGAVEDTFTASVSVAAVDKSSRKITLAASDGGKATFTAGPEIRNFDQIRVGDKVTATFTERLVVFVRGDGADPSVSHAAALAAAPKGAKPGVMVGEAYEIVASIKSIDSANRTATLQFSAGQAKTVKVRQDVDLARYKAGDTVVIQVSAALALLVTTP